MQKQEESSKQSLTLAILLHTFGNHERKTEKEKTEWKLKSTCCLQGLSPTGSETNENTTKIFSEIFSHVIDDVTPVMMQGSSKEGPFPATPSPCCLTLSVFWP